MHICVRASFSFIFFSSFVCFLAFSSTFRILHFKPDITKLLARLIVRSTTHNCGEVVPHSPAWYVIKKLMKRVSILLRYSFTVSTRIKCIHEILFEKWQLECCLKFASCILLWNLRKAYMRNTFWAYERHSSSTNCPKVSCIFDSACSMLLLLGVFILCCYILRA